MKKQASNRHILLTGILIISTILSLSTIFTSCGKSIKVNLPEVPVSVTEYRGGTFGGWYKASTINITEITYETEGETLIISISGEKTDGVSYFSSCRGGYRLLDSQGCVVDEDTFTTPDLVTGEKFANLKIRIYDLDVNETYTFELVNYSI